MATRKAVPFSFVLDELMESPLADLVRTRPMFGCLAVYIDTKIVFILRDKSDAETARDNGIWLATVPEQSAALRELFPVLRPIEMFTKSGLKGEPGWLNLANDHDGFEESALEACRLVIRGDRRIGKIPKPKKKPRR